MTKESIDISSRVEKLEELVSEYITNTDNTIEDLFYSLVAIRTNQKSLQEIIELAVVEHFKIKRTDFHRVNMGIYGDASTIPDEIRRVAHARKWHMSIMMNILHIPNHTMKMNYSWYNNKKAFEHRPAYMGALNPVTDIDKENRCHLVSITDIVKRMATEERIFDDRIDLF